MTTEPEGRPRKAETRDKFFRTLCDGYADECDNPCNRKGDCPINEWIAQHPSKAWSWNGKYHS